MKKKLCTKCKRKRDITTFYEDTTRKDGHTAVCKDCRRTWAKAHARDKRAAHEAGDPIREGVDAGIL